VERRIHVAPRAVVPSIGGYYQARIQTTHLRKEKGNESPWGQDAQWVSRWALMFRLSTKEKRPQKFVGPDHMKNLRSRAEPQSKSLTINVGILLKVAGKFRDKTQGL